MLHNYFDKIYLINLDYRKDRLKESEVELNKYSINYERFSAYDGIKNNIQIPSAASINEPEQYWNQGAAGMCMSLINIFKKSQEMKYKSVLIMEDDIEFRDGFVNYFDSWYNEVPKDYNSLFFGINNRSSEKISEHVIRIKSAYALHCHVINESVYQLLIDKLSLLNNPADKVYDLNLFQLNKSYCFNPFIAFQRPSYSSITNMYADYTFLRN